MRKCPKCGSNKTKKYLRTGALNSGLEGETVDFFNFKRYPKYIEECEECKEEINIYSFHTTKRHNQCKRCHESKCIVQDYEIIEKKNEILLKIKGNCPKCIQRIEGTRTTKTSLDRAITKIEEEIL